ncbi:hypothetical protein SH449x_000467 [Pirellulaceae bacterium SH449]
MSRPIQQREFPTHLQMVSQKNRLYRSAGEAFLKAGLMATY